MKTAFAAGAVMALVMATSALAQSGVYFEDGFDGDALKPEWQVLNPDPDAYLVESGVLTMLSPDGVPAEFDRAANVLRLNMPVPKGDWTMTTRFTITPQTMGEILRIGVAKDAKNSLFAGFSMENGNYADTTAYLLSNKLAKGKSTYFYRAGTKISERDIEARAAQFTDKVGAVLLRLQKTGRKYTASLRFEPAGAVDEGGAFSDWISTQALTSLRAPGDAFTVIFGNRSNDYSPNDGEGLVEIDWIKIETNP